MQWKKSKMKRLMKLDIETNGTYLVILVFIQPIKDFNGNIRLGFSILKASFMTSNPGFGQGGGRAPPSGYAYQGICIIF